MNFKSLRRALLGLTVIASSTVAVAVPVATAAESDGTVDTGYGSSGVASFAGQFRKTLALSDGKIVAFADIDTNSDYAPDKVEIKRFTTAGALDTSFGLSGTMTIQPSGHTYIQYSYSFADASGGFYVVYTSNDPNQGPMQYNAGKMIKVTSAGVQDLNFGTGGEAIVPAPAGSQSIGGKWVDASSGNIYTVQYGNVSAIVKQASNGVPDTTFGPNSKAYIDWPYSGPCQKFWRTGRMAIWVDPAESYALISAFVEGAGSARVLGVAKFDFTTRACSTTYGTDNYNANGSSRTPDSTPDGYAEVDLISGTTTLEGTFNFQEDGSLIVLASDSSSIMKIAKVTAAGALDTSFNTTGMSPNVWTELAGSYSNYPNVFVLSNGSVRVVAAPRSGSGYANIVGLTSGGVLDSSFGTNGVATSPQCSNIGQLIGSVRLPDGSIVANSVLSTGNYPNNVYNSYLVKLGNGGSASQCGTTTTTTTTTNAPYQPPSNSIGSAMSSSCSGGQSMNLSGGTGGTFDFTMMGCTGTNVYVVVEGPSVSGASFSERSGSNWVPFSGSAPQLVTSTPTKANLNSFSAMGTAIKVLFLSTGTYKIYTVSETCYNSLASSSTLVTTCATSGYSFWSINILGGGSSPSPSTPCVAGAPASSNSEVTFDTSFSTDGVYEFTDQYGSPAARDAVAGPNGTVLVATMANLASGGSPTNSYSRIYRLLSDGTPDSTWGTGGFVDIDVSSSTSTSENVGDVVVHSDGSVYVSLGYSTYSQTPTYFVSVVKLTPAGAIDASWASNGELQVASVSGGSSNTFPMDLEVGPSGSLYLSKSVYNGSSSTYSLVKITAAGALDSSFGSSGELSMGSTSAFSVDSAGALYVGGRTSSTPADAKITKYSSSGAVDTSFGTSGEVVLDVSPTEAESLGSLKVANGKITGTAQISGAVVNGFPSYSVFAFRLGVDGSRDSSFGTSGVSPLGTMGGAPSESVVLDDGSILLGTRVLASSPLWALSALSANGTPSGTLVSAPATLSSGTCALSVANIVATTAGVYVAGSRYPTGGGSFTGHMFKVAISGVVAGGGSSASQAPTLVTSANAASLVRTPGSQSIIVNGQEVVIESSNIEVPAALVPAALRTPAQVASIQAAGASLLAAFIASLPAGSTTDVVVVNTATGAVMRNLVFDANGNAIDVPVEDIQFLDGPAISLMIGSNNANITADGKYQVGAGGIIGVTGSGLGSTQAGELVAMSTPTLIGNFTTTAQGDFNKSAQLPSSIGVGDHTLVVATGSTYAVMGIRVVPSSLPATGGSGQRTVVIALFTLVFGGVFFRSRRVIAA